MRVTNTRHYSPRSSSEGGLSARSSMRHSARQSRVSSPDQRVTRVTVAPRDPVSREGKPSYRMALYLGVGLLACVSIALVSTNRTETATLIPVDSYQLEPIMIENEKAEAETSKPSRRKSYAKSVDDLSDEQCKEIFEHCLFRPPSVLKYNKYTQEVDVRLSQPWVEGMKETMQSHANKLLRQLYTKFEALPTVQLAVYLGELFRPNQIDDYKEYYAELMYKRFSVTVFHTIVHDKDMRRYLAYRGLRSQLNNGKWGTIAYGQGRSQSTTPDAKGSGWRWVRDEDNMHCFVRSYGQEGTWYSVYDSPAQTADVNGTGVANFGPVGKGRAKLLKEMERIFQVGGL